MNKIQINQLVYLFIILTLKMRVTNGQQMFSNPIRDDNSADPSVLLLGQNYYLTLSTNGEREISVYQSSQLTNFRSAVSTVAYRANEFQHDLWASEMHSVDGGLYIYFAMADEKGSRMYALEAEDPQNPTGKWKSPVRLMPNFDEHAIDGTIFNHGNGQRYFVWSSFSGLWIARMKGPMEVDESMMPLRYPSAPWECAEGLCINEGPFFIYNQGVSFLIFSASGTFVPDYCMGMMSIEGSNDPMVPSNWWYGDNQPIFVRNDDEDVYTTGHASFTTSPDGSETWMVYHGSNVTSGIEGHRTARLERIQWGSDGFPLFPRAHGYHHLQPVPSGQI